MPRYKDKSREYGDDLKAEVRKVVWRNTIRVQTEARRLANLRSYLKSKPRSPSNRRSLPGEPPAVNDGILLRSIESEVIERKTEIVGRVGSNLDYARFLEEGTEHILPRPFLDPALKTVKRRFIADLRKLGVKGSFND